MENKAFTLINLLNHDKEGHMRDLRAFQPGKIGNLTIKNRLVRSATFEYMGTENGEVSDRLVDLYRNLAVGGVGLIVTGFASVHPHGYVHPQQMRIHNDSYIDGIRRISDVVHELDNGCRIFIQLNHTGRQQVSPELVSWAVAPSAVYDKLFLRTPRGLSLEEIEDIIDCFAEAIRRARDAGFDGVQLHAAYGWLLSSFLSPHTNRRSDAHGGTTENRTRIFSEIYRRVRSKVSKDYPIIVKLSTEDFLSGGMDLAEGKRVAAILARIGYTALEISAGMWEAMTRDEQELGWKPFPIPEARVGIDSRDKEAYFWNNAKEVRKVVDVPIILVGGIRSLDTIEEVLAEGSVDLCAMSRPLVKEPDLPNKWLTSVGELRAECISCNACLPHPGRSLGCRITEQPSEKEALEVFPYFRGKG